MAVARVTYLTNILKFHTRKRQNKKYKYANFRLISDEIGMHREHECEVIWVDSVVFKTPKHQEANILTYPNQDFYNLT